MKLCMSALGYTRKFKVSIGVHLLSINQIFQYRHAPGILCNVGKVYISLKHARKLTLGMCVPI